MLDSFVIRFEFYFGNIEVGTCKHETDCLEECFR